MTEQHAAGEPRIVVVPAPDATGRVAAEEIAAGLAAAAEARGVAHLATTGGSTPMAVYRALAAPPLRDRVPWDRTHVWWTDDRFVPRDHELSNVKPLDDVLLGEGQAPLPAANIHPFPTNRALSAGRDGTWCADALEAELRTARLESREGWPVLDVVLLGVGSDGHILSVFPGSSAFDADAWALPIPAPTHIEPHVPRVTLNPYLVTVARRVVVVAHGAGKAEVLRAILRGDRTPERLPAQLARRTGATWVLDDAAAERLDGAVLERRGTEPAGEGAG